MLSNQSFVKYDKLIIYILGNAFVLLLNEPHARSRTKYIFWNHFSSGNWKAPTQNVEVDNQYHIIISGASQQKSRWTNISSKKFCSE